MEQMKNDAVNHPSHYTDGKYECIDFIESWGLGFHLGNAVKYITRAGKKDPGKTKEDLEKAIWYVKRARTYDKPHIYYASSITTHCSGNPLDISTEKEKKKIDAYDYICDKQLSYPLGLALFHIIRGELEEALIHLDEAILEVQYEVKLQ